MSKRLVNRLKVLSELDATGATLTGFPAPGNGGAASVYILATHRTAAGVDAGSLANGAWGTRILNTLDADGGGIATLSNGNQLALPAGGYACRIVAPANRVGANSARLFNVTTGAVLQRGTMCFSHQPTDNATSFSHIAGPFTLAGASVLEIQHRTAGAVGAAYEAGAGNNWGDPNVYLIAEFWKLS